ncbi:MAG: SelT/SelW/SelH family protein [Opitutae bacterium]|jgi:selenoprotein W-related protein|nr:SelT/SelW/SelH family protein [Opitutae bacterium]MBT4225113.1 SelT/SelW/SelH family protein [Opitutae bacterium]MBT5380077.1 SelT/SelW/SelH family protein [Opitutae bacterium]MBT5690073.1 SelT/SelW/SelH family protein [Opitutae bacterium]MBT6462146.1 SelT/SelW/SelH family protein [Opitutae bacterium]
MNASNPENENRIIIEYCPGCRWLLRSAWMAQEILTTFEAEIHEVTLRPSKTETGRFTINFGKELIWCRKRNDGFPEIKTLKQLIRNKIAPDKDLGHIDR